MPITTTTKGPETLAHPTSNHEQKIAALFLVDLCWVE